MLTIGIYGVVTFILIIKEAVTLALTTKNNDICPSKFDEAKITQR